ncbi:hypothetical protein E1H13_22385 [Nodosilinea sp. P-1105]|nr:hypothetical protein [Nodosilinea sp. P-1105]
MGRWVDGEVGRWGGGEVGGWGEFWILNFGFWIEAVGCIDGRGLGIGGQPGAAMHRSGKERYRRGGPMCPPWEGMLLGGSFGFWILDSSLCYARATPYVLPFSFFVLQMRPNVSALARNDGILWLNREDMRSLLI